MSMRELRKRITFLERQLEQAIATATAQSEATRQAALAEAIEACLRAIPDRAAVRAIGESAHYKACADAIRSIADGKGGA